MQVRSSLLKNRTHLADMSAARDGESALAAYGSLMAGLGLPLKVRTLLAHPPSTKGWHKLVKQGEALLVQLKHLPKSQRPHFEALFAADKPSQITAAAEAIAKASEQTPFTADFVEGYRQSLRGSDILRKFEMGDLSPFNPGQGSSTAEAQTHSSVSGAAADGATLGAALGGTAGAIGGGIFGGGWPGAALGATVFGAIGGLGGAIAAAVLYVAGQASGGAQQGGGGTDEEGGDGEQAGGGEGEGGGEGGGDSGGSGGSGGSGSERVRTPSGLGLILFDAETDFSGFENLSERGLAQENT